MKRYRVVKSSAWDIIESDDPNTLTVTDKTYADYLCILLNASEITMDEIREGDSNFGYFNWVRASVLLPEDKQLITKLNNTGDLINSLTKALDSCRKEDISGKSYLYNNLFQGSLQGNSLGIRHTGATRGSLIFDINRVVTDIALNSCAERVWDTKKVKEVCNCFIGMQLLFLL